MLIWFPTTKSRGITLIYLCAGDMPHIIGKISMRDTSLLLTAPQSKVCTRNYGLPKLKESQFQEFWDSQLGSPRTKWNLNASPVARDKEYYKWDGGDFPQLWAVVNLVSSCLPMVCPCTKSAPLRINQLVVWFVQVCVNNWPTCHSFYFPSQNSNTTFYPQSVTN
jgi:hypothetical protein